MSKSFSGLIIDTVFPNEHNTKITRHIIRNYRSNK